MNMPFESVLSWHTVWRIHWKVYQIVSLDHQESQEEQIIPWTTTLTRRPCKKKIFPSH